MNDNDAAEGGPPATAPGDCGEPRLAPSRLPILMRCSGAAIESATGLALDFDRGVFVIEVHGASGGRPLRLGSYPDEDVIAIWRRLSAVSGLPLLLPGPDGTLQQPYPQTGRVLVGTRCERRRLAVLSGRRPRFLAKRRTTIMPRRPRVHREPEIAAGLSR